MAEAEFKVEAELVAISTNLLAVELGTVPFRDSGTQAPQTYLRPEQHPAGPASGAGRSDAREGLGACAPPPLLLPAAKLLASYP